MRQQVWRGTLIAVLVGSPLMGCTAMNWDFKEAQGQAGAGGTGGSANLGGMGGIAGMGGDGGSAGGGGMGGGSIEPCAGCTYGVRFGDDKDQTLSHVALASDGSVYFAGHYDGELRLDSTTFLADQATATQPFLGKLDRQGKPLWLKTPSNFPTAGGRLGVISMASGVIAWVGTVVNGTSKEDTFVEIYDEKSGSNVPIVQQTYGSTANDGLRSAALSPDGKTLFIAGAFAGNASTFKNCPLFTTSSSTDRHLVVFAINTADGTCAWGRRWSGASHAAASIAVATGSDGAVFVSGYFTTGAISNVEGFTFPAVVNQPAPKLDATGYVMKLDKANGTMLAAKGYANTALLGTTVDRSTNTVLVSGSVGASVLFKGMTLPAAADATDASDQVILGFDEYLSEQWSLIHGGPNRQVCPNVTTDGAGRAYAACLTQDIIDRGLTVACGGGGVCSVVVPIATKTGMVFPDKVSTFGQEAPALFDTQTFVAAATPNALAVGGSWTADLSFWDKKLLDVNWPVSNHDIAIGKVEPVP